MQKISTKKKGTKMIFVNLYDIDHMHSFFLFFFPFSFWVGGCLVINGVEMGKYVYPSIQSSCHGFYNFVLPFSFHKNVLLVETVNPKIYKFYSGNNILILLFFCIFVYYYCWVWLNWS